jgi:hypothetical protein
MRKLLITAATIGALAAIPSVATAQVNTAAGVAVGAGTGALIGGPPGAIVGGIIGGTVGATTEPRAVYYAHPPRVYVEPRYRECWRDHWGRLFCR